MYWLYMELNVVSTRLRIKKSIHLVWTPPPPRNGRTHAASSKTSSASHHHARPDDGWRMAVKKRLSPAVVTDDSLRFSTQTSRPGAASPEGGFCWHRQVNAEFAARTPAQKLVNCEVRLPVLVKVCDKNEPYNGTKSASTAAPPRWWPLLTG